MTVTHHGFDRLLTELKSQRQAAQSDAAWPSLCTLSTLSVVPLAMHVRRVVARVIKPAAVAQAAVTQLTSQTDAVLMPD